MGSVEGCFLSPIPGSTTPMLVRALGVIVRRTILYGKSVCYRNRGVGVPLGKDRQQSKYSYLVSNFLCGLCMVGEIERRSGEMETR